MSELTKQWNNLVTEHGPISGAFLQSWEWGEFQQNLGRTIYRYALVENEWTLFSGSENQTSKIKNQNDDSKFKLNEKNLLELVQIIKIPLPIKKSYLYVPKGPIIISDFRFQISDFKNELQQLVKKEKAIFIKMELPIEKKDFNEINLQPTTYSLQPKSIQPQDTLILDLSKLEEELLAGMHEKTRYNIRLAERKDVQVRWATTKTLEKDLEDFWKLAQETAKRDEFSYHPKGYYQKMLTRFQVLGFRFQDKKNLIANLILAERNNEVLAANIVVFFGNTVTYLHGASNYARREFMAPHLLQWRTIQEAKQLGYKYYDFWGVAPSIDLRPMTYNLQPKSHPWSGITRFKLGFGGEIVSYAPTFDLIINNFWYKLYCLGKLLLKS